MSALPAPGRRIGNPPHVLLVDDEAFVLRALERIMQASGFQATSAGGATEALAAVRRGGIDVVVSDLWMPERNGLDLLQEVRALDPSLPVILLSGSATDVIVQTASALGVFSFLRKPLRAVELQQTVDAALAARCGRTFAL
jgi:two-component system, NtrC family, nitrogen regulation response regulator NtrX